MKSLENKRVLVTGGSRGLGLGVVEALVARRANVTVLARDPARLAAVEEKLGVETVAGDITDRELARSVIERLRPDVLVLTAGVAPPMKPIHEHTWESFSATWNSDVKAGLFWIQEAIRLPLARGSRVLLGSSGAAVNGSPLSGGHGGAKRMLWMMTHYANGVSAELDLGIRFQVLVPQQVIGETDHGRAVADAYAARKGITREAFLANFGAPMPPRDFGEHVATILTDEKYDGVTAFGLKGEKGITALDG